jgi:hypothetical protein
MKRREFVIAGGALAASMALPARAAYPEKPVRYIIAFAPGGSRTSPRACSRRSGARSTRTSW